MPDEPNTGGAGTGNQEPGAGGSEQTGGARMVQVSEAELADLRRAKSAYNGVTNDLHKNKTARKQWEDLFEGKSYEQVAEEMEERRKREEEDRRANMSAEERMKTLVQDHDKERQAWARKENEYKTELQTRDETLRNERLQNKVVGVLSMPETRATSPEDAFIVMKSRGAVQLSDDGTTVLWYNPDKTPMLNTDGTPVGPQEGARRWLEANPHYAEAVFRSGSGMRTTRGQARSEEEITADINALVAKLQNGKITRDEYDKKLEALDEEAKAAGISSEFDRETIQSSR